MKANITFDIGNRIRAERENFKYTREQLAELIKISPQFLSSMENGSRGMSFSTLQKICEVLILFGKMMNNNIDEINKLVSGIDKKYLPIIEDLIRSYIKTIVLTKNLNSNSDNSDE